MLTNSMIILAIGGCDTLRPLCIQIRPFTNKVLDTKYHKWCSQKQYCEVNPDDTVDTCKLLKCLHSKKSQNTLKMKRTTMYEKANLVSTFYTSCPVECTLDSSHNSQYSETSDYPYSKNFHITSSKIYFLKYRRQKRTNAKND